MKKYDLIIVGAGMSGLRAAIEAVKQDLHVAVISKVHPLRSSSVVASAGLNAVLPKRDQNKIDQDSIEQHFQDTMKCGYRASDPETLQILVNKAPAKIRELERWGCLFSREKDDSIAQRKIGASSFPRTVYSSDKTGHVVMNTLYEQCIRLRQNKPDLLRFYDEWFVQKLLVHNNVTSGVIALEIATGRMEVFTSRAVIWASGGSGRIFGNTSNPLANSGWGLAVPMYAGAALRDMEFIQFHPTQLSGSHILITEAARGEGAVLLNRKGQRFLESYSDTKERKELSSEDVISRNIRREILAGRGIEANCVHLDLRGLGSRKIKNSLPGVRELCKTYANLDPIRQKIPVSPGQHYMIGGINTNEKTQTDIEGFFAAGECACNGVHGMNRMGGNSLMETLVFGEIAALKAATYIQQKHHKPSNRLFYENAFSDEKKKVKSLLKSHGKVKPAEIRDKMNQTMNEFVGIYRDGMGLVEAGKIIKELKNTYQNNLMIQGNEARANFGLIEAIELKGSLDIADIIIQSALKRKESIGVHFRNDFPSYKGRPRYSMIKVKKNKIKIRHISIRTQKNPLFALFSESRSQNS
ncbi:MAG: FAD-binding protein [Candidatus Marinimicrobia bacterium]|nr:FAD-binding protein [Candidatus Neomarinimicrobiota bacterium]